MPPNIVVIGAGVVGLSTAVNVQMALPGSKVTVIAEQTRSSITSFGSGGLFVPTTAAYPDTPLQSLKKWSRTSWEFYRSLVTGPEAGSSGGIAMSGYYLSKTPYKDPLYKDLVFSYRQLSNEELQKLNVDPIYRYGYQITTVKLHQAKYLDWLMERFKRNGGEFVQRKVKSFDEFVGRYSVVVNCSGLGSRQLVGDDNVYPVRGHIIQIKAPWIKQWIYTDEMAYIIPGEELVGLGGLKQPHNVSMTVDPRDTKDILDRCVRIMPSVKTAAIDHEWIGLRPMRTGGIRVEAEVCWYSKGSIQVVHNYGHGSSGVAMSWGTAVDCAALVTQAVENTVAGSKL